MSVLQRMKPADFARAQVNGAKRLAANDVTGQNKANIQVSRDAPPPGSLPFDYAGAITIPIAIPSGFVDVLRFVVPSGYNGVIWGFSNTLEGGSTLIPSNASLIWQLRVNGAPVRNWERIIVQNGGNGQPRPTYGIPLRENDNVTFVVNHDNDPALGGGDTTCTVQGYFYPSA